MTCFLKKWLRVTGLEGLRGIGARELNTQHCDETQCKIMNETGYAFNINQKKANE